MPRSHRRRLAQSAHPGTGLVRLIAGQWRGRQLPVLNAKGLRPSGDRLRETLFNWLQFDLAGARCLDLFAGSGALGLEAASRGAQHVDLIEAHSAVAENLVQQVLNLGGQESVQVHHCEAETHLETLQEPYDVVFIDPPFDMNCQERLMLRLKKSDLLAPDARVYVESPGSQSLPDPLEGYDLLRCSSFGDVKARLYVAGQ